MLGALLAMDHPLEVIHRELAMLPWDCPSPLVTLRADHVVRVLQRFLTREFDRDTIERWANALEGREDIGLDAPIAAALKQMIFELANPDLAGYLTDDSATEYVKQLRSLYSSE
jgi:hypothetical protein